MLEYLILAVVVLLAVIVTAGCVGIAWALIERNPQDEYERKLKLIAQQRMLEQIKKEVQESRERLYELNTRDEKSYACREAYFRGYKHATEARRNTLRNTLGMTKKTKRGGEKNEPERKTDH